MTQFEKVITDVCSTKAPLKAIIEQHPKRKQLQKRIRNSNRRPKGRKRPEGELAIGVADSDTIVSGTKGKASYVVYGRRLSSGLTEVDLITNGL